MMTPIPWDDQEPTPGELARIEREWPLIEAELALLDAQIRALSATGGPSPLDWRRLRRAQRRMLAARLRMTGLADLDEAPGVAS